MVATPIGNLADLTLRAIHVLSRVQVVACEDTRVAGQLLQHLGLVPRLLALHKHNEREASAAVIERLAAGDSVAMISDAGTPAVSDPGALLVAAVQAAGHRNVPIPGASSLLAALCVAGDAAASGFRFVGFLPAKGAQREQALQAVAADGDTQVLFEAPHRIQSLAAALGIAQPGRRVTLCRELTKQFETVATMPGHELAAWLAADDQRQRGEFVLVLHAMPAAAAPEDGLSADAERALAVLLRELPLKQAVALAAEISGAARNALYARALELKQ